MSPDRYADFATRSGLSIEDRLTLFGCNRATEMRWRSNKQRIPRSVAVLLIWICAAPSPDECRKRALVLLEGACQEEADG